MPNLRTSFVTSFVTALTLTNSGCATRVILVPNGDPVRLAEPVRAKVWVPDASGQIVQSQNRVTIPAGWYALPRNK